jgi:glucose-6-phosphate 1-epimerase
VKKQSANVTIPGETDRVYHPAKPPSEPVTICEDGKAKCSLVRDNLTEVVVWNPWSVKAAGMSDFEPKDGWQQMICVEPGSVKGWQTLEPGDTFEGTQMIMAG